MPAILPPHVELETRTYRCALAIRFVDTALNEVVTSGLQVTATSVNDRERVIEAKANRSGTWLFYGLPGQRGYELGAPDQSGASPLEPARFIVTVRDELGRFLPCRFEATVSHHERFNFLTIASPPWAGGNVPLFSSPARFVHRSCGVVRGQLVFSSAQNLVKPAAWALMQVTVIVRNGARDPIHALGVADAQGSVAVMFPWPELFGLPNASPRGGGQIEDQGWDLSVRGWHDLQSRNPKRDEPFDLDQVLGWFGAPSNILQTAAAPYSEFSNAILKFGRELVIPEQGGLNRVLILTSGTSPL
jgi:hypothetical protein